MMFFAPRNKSLLKILTTFFFALTISFPASANPADWGMVQQFNKKSELANQGNIRAMYDVGKLYERGRGVNKNITKAAEWFQKAASVEHAPAQARLGILYFEGRGVAQNYNKALALLTSAAKQNIPSAQFQLANMYELGTGVSQNLKKSIAWYKKADQYGYYLAKAKVTRLEKILSSGDSVSPDKKSETTASANPTSTPLIQTILRGHWLKRKSAVGYLPSIISNCAKSSPNSVRCISTAQERSTGSEIIAYNTESIVTMTNKTTFDIEYTNNVLEVALLETVDGDGETIEQIPSRIKKGQKGKKRNLKCLLKNNKKITCSKGSSSFDLVSQ